MNTVQLPDPTSPTQIRAFSMAMAVQATEPLPTYATRVDELVNRAKIIESYIQYGHTS